MMCDTYDSAYMGSLVGLRHGRVHLMCRAQLRRLTGEEKWKGRLQLRKRKDHFIFTVQSTGERRLKLVCRCH